MLYGEDEDCTCDPCTCETPGEMSPPRVRSNLSPELEELEEIHYIEKAPGGYQLDEFIRAKEYFMSASTVSGLSLYDHLSEVIRKLLDSRNPPNVVDFVEEISMNIKRYRFGMKKDIMRDPQPIPEEMLKDSKELVDSWKKHALWSIESSESMGEDKPSFGGFPNLMRLLYYLEQINIGLPREEMLRIALSLRQLIMTKPITRARFWGKVIGLHKNYYIVEAEMKGEDQEAAWVPPSPETMEQVQAIPEPDIYAEQVVIVPGSGATFQRAGLAVTDPDFLTAYQETSGLPPDANSIVVAKKFNAFETEYLGEGLLDETSYDDPEAAAEQARWLQYQNELMTGFPTSAIEVKIEIPPEAKGVGVNRRTFYICNDLGQGWTILPDVTPQHINTSRRIRWFLTGNLENQIKTIPEFPGFEGHYLRAMLARITAGAMVSPRGYFKTRKYDAEYDGEDEDEEDIEEEEEEDRNGDDTVYPMKKYKPPPMVRLLNPTMEVWVHHTGYILRQGRANWWNPKKSQKKEVQGEDDDEDVEDEEEDEEETETREKELGPSMFKSLTEDKSLDGVSPWSTRASSTVFTEFQVASARSNLWPGSTAMCTSKGKVENIYIGDGLKFFGHTYSPFVPEECNLEYKEGPELKEGLDPTPEVEKKWLSRLQFGEIGDVEDPFVDNEDEAEEETENEDVTDDDN